MRFRTKNTLYEVIDGKLKRNGVFEPGALFVGSVPMEGGRIREPKLSAEGHLIELVPEARAGYGAVFMNMPYEDKYWERLGDGIKILNNWERGLLSGGLLMAYKGLTNSIEEVFDE